MNDLEFDRRARALHSGALAAISPRVRAQLHNRRRAMATRPSRAPHHWSWAAAAVLALALAFGAPWRSMHEPASDTRVAQVPATAAPAPATLDQTLDQDPDFYLWLASADAVALASE
jgi:hypothetical protein